MKMIKYIPLALVGVMAFASCQDDMEDFDNSISAPTVAPVNTVNVKLGMETATGYVEANLSKRADADVTVTFFADNAKVAEYNGIYGQQYQELPSKYYRIPNPTATIPAGGNSTGKVAVEFMNLSQLDVSKTYVLPVSMSSSSVETLNNGTYYFVLKEASLVSVAPDMTKNYAKFAVGNQAPLLGGMTQVTVQALLYPYDFPNMLATVMGIEGQFLVRIGDAGVPANQLQLATSNGNVTDPAWQFELNKWTELTLTFDCATGETKVYFNGIQKGSTQMSNFRGPVEWNTASGDIQDGPRGFYVGYAYDGNRYFNGEMCELRVWNRVLTQEEIQAPYQAYNVETNSPGLVAYWKADEGSGDVLHDYANGYDLKCDKAPEWIPQALPAKK